MMQIVNFGHFTRQNDTGVLFYVNELGQDWYEMRRALTRWTAAGEFIDAVYGTWVTVTPDAGSITSGVVLHVERDPSRLVPDGRIVLGIDADPATIQPGMVFANGSIAAPPPLTPEQKRANMPPITRRQLQLALVRNNITLASVEATIAAMPEGLQKDEAKIEWSAAGQFNRLQPTLLLIAVALNLTPEAVDAMWTQALAI